MKAYKSLILDVDGVLFDSNTIKHENIREAVNGFADNKLKEDFLDYFISNNGFPREGKIEKFFGAGTTESNSILTKYNKLNAETLLEAKMTIQALDCLKYWSKNARIWALSGGDENEVKALFDKNNISQFFTGIHGGPTKKKNHIIEFDLSEPCLYVGDSQVDYETAKLVDCDFAFMYRYTQFDKWKEFFRDKTEVILIENLSHIIR